MWDYFTFRNFGLFLTNRSDSNSMAAEPLLYRSSVPQPLHGISTTTGTLYKPFLWEHILGWGLLMA